MPNRLKPLNLVDWTGGVNLRPESYQLQENELPELLNMEVDPRGGLNTRRGWKTTAVSSAVAAGGDGYLNPTVGTVTSPDPGPLPAECVLVFKVRGPTFTPTPGTSTVASQWTPGGANCSWYLQQDHSPAPVYNSPQAWTVLGTSAAGADAASICKPQAILPGEPPVDMRVAAVVRLSSAGQQVVATMFDASGSISGTPSWVGLYPAQIPTVPVFDASGTLRIGGLAPGVGIYQGRIYWVELRTGVDPNGGTVLWRFDSNDYPGSGTTYVDPRGRTWTLTSASAITPKPTPGVWNPRNAYLHARSNATNPYMMLVCNNGGVATRTDPSTTWVNTVASGCTAEPHGADFASWDNQAWIVCGSGQTVTYDGVNTIQLPASGSANWQNDYTATGGTDTAPIASLIAQHQGYMFMAGTVEDGGTFPNRVRWSWPNNPRRWAKADYIDISEGGQRITGMIPFSDRVLIFKPDSVWALFGYDADTWTLTNLSRTIGCLNQQLVCRSEAAVFFLSWPQGIFAYTEKGNVDEISIQLRRVFEDHSIDPAAMRNAWMGWVGRRLWVSLPYALPQQRLTTPPADAVTAFVFDPVVNSWTMFQGADGNIPGPYLERIEADDEENQVSFARKTPYTIRLDGRTEAAVDEYLPGVVAPFTTRMRTRWIDAGAPTWKKSWRRPDFLLRALERDAIVNVQVFHDFDSYNAERSFAIAFTPDNEPSTYNKFAWGDGTLYGGADQTSSVERGGTMGRAGTVQLAMSGTPGVPWGLNGIIFKFIPRRFR